MVLNNEYYSMAISVTTLTLPYAIVLQRTAQRTKVHVEYSQESPRLVSYLLQPLRTRLHTNKCQGNQYQYSASADSQ